MEKTFLGDWNRNFLPIKNVLAVNNLNLKIPITNTLKYKELNFTVNELFFKLGTVSYNIVNSYLQECYSIISLISIILSKKENIFETLYTTRQTFLNKNQEEINDFKVLIENGFTEKLILKRINVLFNKKSNFSNMFHKLFKIRENEDPFIVYMYFISCFIEIYKLHNFMTINKLNEVNLASKTYTINKILSDNSYYFIEVFLKGDNEQFEGCMHTYSLNLLEDKVVAKSFNTFMLNEYLKKQSFKLFDLSIYLNDSYFEIVDKTDLTISEKKILKFLFNYIQYKVLKDSLDLQDKLENNEI